MDALSSLRLRTKLETFTRPLGRTGPRCHPEISLLVIEYDEAPPDNNILQRFLEDVHSAYSVTMEVSTPFMALFVASGASSDWFAHAVKHVSYFKDVMPEEIKERASCAAIVLPGAERSDSLVLTAARSAAGPIINKAIEGSVVPSRVFFDRGEAIRWAMEVHTSDPRRANLMSDNPTHQDLSLGQHTGTSVKTDEDRELNFIPAN